MKILPPKKVPVVRTTERTGINLPRSVTTAVSFCLLPDFAASVRMFFSVNSPGISPDWVLSAGGSGVSLSVVSKSTTVSIKV